MKKNLYILLILFVMSITYSCKKDMITYEGENSIYFEMQLRTPTGLGIWPHADTTKLPFSTTIEDDSTYLIKFKLLGKVVDYDRKINLRVVETSTAVYGREYEFVPEVVILPAGKELCYMPIKFMRSLEVYNEHLYLTLELLPSNDFPSIFRYYRSTDFNTHVERDVVVSKHTIDISDAVFKPLVWNDYIMGPFSEYKFKFINESFGLIQDDWSSQDVMPFARVKYMAMSIKRLIIQKEEEGDPLFERDRKGNILYQTNSSGEFVLDKDGNKIPIKLLMGAGV